MGISEKKRRDGGKDGGDGGCLVCFSVVFPSFKPRSGGH